MLGFLKKIFGRPKALEVDRRGDVAQLTRHNSADAYDKLWGDQELLDHYLEPARLEAYRDIAKYILQKGFGPKIVELGFGSADFLNILINENKNMKFEVCGLDYAESGVKRARKLIPEGKFIHGNIYHLPYKNDYFDQVFCLQTLEHLHDPLKAIEEMDRICKPDGMILITVPNGDLDNFEGHVHFWSESALTDLVQPRNIIDFLSLNENRAFMVSVNPLKDK